jgi:C1A family cysteine protease
MSIINRKFTLKKQEIDHRDHIYESTNENINDFHYLLDISTVKCPILDQGNIGSCLSNAICALMYILSNGKIKFSRLHFYLCYRQCNFDSLTEDTGGTMRSAMKAIKSYGLSSENIWPYVNETINFKYLSPSASFINKYNIQKFSYKFIVQNEISIKNCLSSGQPIVIGICIYDSFYTNNVDKYGIIPMPDLKKEPLFGYHAVLLIGYDDTSRTFKFQNSWGVNWGDKGYGYFPYDYILNKDLTFDLCTVYFNI